MENRKKNDWGSKIPKKKFYCIVIKLKLFDVFDTLGCWISNGSIQNIASLLKKRNIHGPLPIWPGLSGKFYVGFCDKHRKLWYVTQCGQDAGAQAPNVLPL